MDNLPLELFDKIKKSIAGEVHYDFTTRLLYSTDASIYQIEPLGVVFPRSGDDIAACVELGLEYQTPIIARGAGSGLGGQAIGAGIILDTSRYLNRIIEFNAEERSIIVEPGVGISAMNRATLAYGLTFGPDPASADRATVGGAIANNATGAHSIIYGMAKDHVKSVDIVLGDGQTACFSTVDLAEANRHIQETSSSAEANLYRTALSIRQEYGELIRQRWPKVWRLAAGYALNYLLPWSASSPPQWFGKTEGLPYPPVEPDTLNLAALMAGSEGTLGIFKQLELNLVPCISQPSLGVFSFDSIAQACDAVPLILETYPSAIELIPGDLIRLARSVPAYAREMSFIQGTPAALFAVEYAHANTDSLRHCAAMLKQEVVIAESPAQQNQIWNVRKAGLGILQSQPGDAKAISFIEDLALPVEKLGYFVREMDHIVEENGTHANYYAHASAGCLHIRPLINLKQKRGIAAMREIAERAVALTLDLGGSVSGEHGLGMARSEWLERQYGKEIIGLFRQIKDAADPYGILNPGKILDAPPMDSHLRYGDDYRTKEWQTILDLSNQGGLSGAIEMCNGAGVCRKTEGVMCPSFQATKDEMKSTRGRANLLRGLISGKFPSRDMGEKAVYEALDTCLACKGCKSECPSAVDVARLKYEFFNHYYQTHRRQLRDTLFGYIGSLAPMGCLFAPLVNAGLSWKWVRKSGERFLGLASARKFPSFAPLTQVQWISKNCSSPQVLFLTDAFSHYFHPETEKAALCVLESLGIPVQVIPVIGAGRTLISKGFLEPASRHARRLVDAIHRIDPLGTLPVLGVEPSEIYTLRDEFPQFFPGDDYVMNLAERAWMIDEFLVRNDEEGKPRYTKLNERNRNIHEGKLVLLHGHCYQKARPPADDGFPIGVNASAALLRGVGYQVEVVDSGCCGMAGAFGYEKEHYAMSIAVGELALFPRMRQAKEDTILAAAGTSCRSQIEDGIARKAVHPICLI